MQRLPFHQTMSRAPRGLTLTEVAVAAAAIGVATCVAVTLPAGRGGGADSQYKLAELAQANACYANDFNERQWTAMPDSAGAFGDDCEQFALSNARPHVMLGRGPGGAYWGYFLGGPSGAGSCANWNVVRAMNFTAADAETGAFRLGNVWGFREYVSRNFYSPEWFAEDDPNFAGASSQFDGTTEFNYPIAALPGGFANSSYCFSPAAMLNPGVLRAKSEGGFQALASFADSHRSPSVTQCLYPSLKSRMCEYSWMRNAPSAGLAFNAGRASAPFTLFFDGSVQKVTMNHAEADDIIVRENSKSGDGLWSDDTPFGVDGWQPDASVDGVRTSFHILTTGGILGRDLLTRE
jgi:hypothetical protein